MDGSQHNGNHKIEVQTVVLFSCDDIMLLLNHFTILLLLFFSFFVLRTLTSQISVALNRFRPLHPL